MKEKYITIISQLDLFKDIEINDIKSLMKCLNPIIYNYKKREYIALRGEKFQGLGIILSGEIIIIKESYSGVRTILTKLKAEDTFGELIAFTEELVWPSSIQCQSDCEVMFINPEKVVNFCDNSCTFHKTLLSNLVKLISKKAQLLHRKVEYLSIKSTRGRISKYLFSQYKKTGDLNLSLDFNREKLAFLLNLSRPALSRELCRMRDEGIIEFYKKTIKITSIEKLRQMIE